jgi:hypothetical protein
MTGKDSYIKPGSRELAAPVAPNSPGSLHGQWDYLPNRTAYSSRSYGASSTSPRLAAAA